MSAKQLKEQMDQLVPKSPQTEVNTQPDYSGVELTPEEEQAAIYEAKKQKYIKAETEQYQRDYWERLTRKQAAKFYTAEELRKKLLLSRNAVGKRFIIDDDNIEQVDLLCMYFSGDIRFEGYSGYSLDKGILIMGGLGVGKTHLMSFFFQNQRASYVMAPCRHIENKWINAKAEDPDPIMHYSGNITGATNGNPYGHVDLGVCFDDLGTETIPAVRYGEKKNVMYEILSARYDRKDSLPFYKTHGTTNLTGDQIIDIYGPRVNDRLIEMCNVITFTSNKSRRV